ncbi:MAG: hypothetical protein LBE17_11710 [Treponema sp.]|nr:hypothetical protein [Treponema sp.]
MRLFQNFSFGTASFIYYYLRLSYRLTMPVSNSNSRFTEQKEFFCSIICKRFSTAALPISATGWEITDIGYLR